MTGRHGRFDDLGQQLEKRLRLQEQTRGARHQDRRRQGFFETHFLEQQDPLLLEANRDQIRDPDLIYPGQVFALPVTN